MTAARDETVLSADATSLWCGRDFRSLGAVVLAVFAYLWWLTPNHPLYVADSIYYLSGAQSLALGGSYHCPVLEGNPASSFYPPLQSLYWTGSVPQVPSAPEGKHPYWTSDRKTCVMPVALKPGIDYHVGLNSVSYKNFQSAAGIPLDPIVYRFQTKAAAP